MKDLQSELQARLERNDIEVQESRRESEAQVDLLFDMAEALAAGVSNPNELKFGLFFSSEDCGQKLFGARTNTPITQHIELGGDGRFYLSEFSNPDVPGAYRPRKKLERSDLVELDTTVSAERAAELQETSFYFRNSDAFTRMHAPVNESGRVDYEDALQVVIESRGHAVPNDVDHLLAAILHYAERYKVKLPRSG